MKQKQAPNSWTLKELPLGLDTISNRFKLAWQVFTGKADTVRWPGGQ